MANQPKKYKKFVATAATATLVASAIVPVASAKSFSDVAENNEFQPFIDALSETGIINGYPDGTFKPGAKLTRGQVVKMLGRWVESNGATVPTDWETVQRFNDVPVNSADKELVKYAALVKDEGVFTGSNGNLMAGNNITRQQMAKVLNGAFTAVNGTSLVDLADNIDNKLVTDLASAQQEFEGYIQALVDLEISTVSVFRPSENVTRAQFAKFLYNTINVEAVGAAGVKAINNTTVEVTFEDNIDDIKALKFTIDGLEVKNAVVKQTDKTTAVLTTAPQEGGKEYTVSVDGDEVGSFTGIAAVIPTSISVVERSQQGVLGQQVTLKAQVTVAEGQSKAGIPVTFNVTGTGSLNTPQLFEATTDENGVATYTYTRYANTTDDVVAYATGDRTKYATGKVYWAAAQQLTVKDITEATTLVNGAKKVYEINQPSNAGGYVFVAFQENLAVTPDKSQRGAIIEGVTTYTINGNTTDTAATNILSSVANEYPYSYSTGGTRVTAVKLDSAGKANLVVSGSNAVVTPIVYSAAYTTNTAGALTHVPAYTATALQAKASTATFELKHALGLTIKAEGVQNAATWVDGVQTGGRDYTVTYTDKDGKAATPGTVVEIAIPRVGGNVSVLNSDGVAVASVNSDAANVYYKLPVEAKGELTFTVVSPNTTAYVAPIAFIDNGKKVNNAPNRVLDTDDLQAQGEITYFTNQVQYSAALKALDAPNGKPVSSVIYGGANAYFTYELVDQNGKPRAYTQDTVVSFEVTAGTGAINVNGDRIEAGNTATVRSTITAGTTSTFVPAFAYVPSSITATATGSRAGVVLPSTNPASVTVNFTQYGTSAITGPAVDVNTALEVLTINNVVYSYTDATYKYNNNVITKSAFVGYISNNDARVSVTVDADGKFTFNVLPATTTPGAGSVLEKVNAATTAAQVQSAIASLPEFKALTAADKTTAVADILALLAVGTVTEQDIYGELIDPTATTFELATSGIAYTAVTPAVSAAKAAATSGTFTLTAKTAGTALNTYVVTVVDTNTANPRLSVVRDDSAKTIVIDVANAPGGAVISTVADVLAALSAEGLDLTSSGTLTGTDYADALVSLSFTLSGGVNAADAIPASIALTFTESVSAKVGDAVTLTLNDGTDDFVITGTVATVADEVVTVTITAETPALVSGDTYTLEGLTGLKSFVDTTFTANAVNFTR